MRSRISIDVDQENQPVIKIDYAASEDVRDKMVKRYLEKFGTDSRQAEFWYGFEPDQPTYDHSTAFLRPYSLRQVWMMEDIHFVTGVWQAYMLLTPEIIGQGVTFCNDGDTVYFHNESNGKKSSSIERVWLSVQQLDVKRNTVINALVEITDPPEGRYKKRMM